MAILSQIFDEYGLNAFIWIKTIIKNGILAIRIPDSPPDYRTLSKDKVRFLLFYEKYGTLGDRIHLKCRKRQIRRADCDEPEMSAQTV